MIFDYFFLKFYKGILKSSIPELPRFMASVLFGLFIHLNLFLISGILAKLDILPFLYSSNTLIIIQLVIIIFLIYLRYNKNRIEVIKLRFATFVTDDEFFLRKKKLNIAFILYLVVTILSLFLVGAFFKPGYLPKISLF